MKKLIALSGLMVLVLAPGCLEKPGGTGAGPLLRCHFAGFTELGRGTNSQLEKIGALPANAALRRQIAQKLAPAPARYWQKHLPAGAADQSALFQPLFDDLLAAESFAEVRGPASQRQLVLAVAASDDRARLWSTNLWQIAAAWKLGPPQPAAIAGGSGWEAAKPDVVLQVVRAGKWIVIGLGSDRANLLPPVLQQISAGAPPLPVAKNLLFELEADFPRLSGVFPGLAEFRLPLTRLTVTNRGDSLRTEARLTFSEKIPWTFEPWRIPTNLISEPINSFTVAQGLAPLLPQWKSVSALGLKNYPNQFCAWGQSYEQVRTFLSVPMSNAAGAVGQISRTLPSVINDWFKGQSGEFLYFSNRAEFIWQTSPPFVAPFVRTATNGGREYLHVGLLPTPLKNEPLPSELFSQLAGRTNLLYYDFEITGERLLHGNQAYQLVDLVEQRLVVATNLPTQAWLLSAVPLLGPSITEATLAGPRELAIVRKSHAGLTGFELATLLRWIESPTFPFHFEPSTRAIRRPKPQAPNNGASPKNP